MHYFYFEAQTGVIRDEPPKLSNYHQYRLPNKCKARVKKEVKNATVGSGGLDYRHDFLVWLSKEDLGPR